MGIEALDDLIVARVRAAPDRLRAVLRSLNDTYVRLGIARLEGMSLPLRPLLLSSMARQQLERGLTACRTALAALDPDGLAAGANPTMLSQWRLHRAQPMFFHIMRPDVRVDQGRFGILDLNVGTPAAVTCFETDVLNDFYRALFEALDIDVDAAGIHPDGLVIEAQCASWRATMPELARVVALVEPSSSLDAQLAEFGGQLAGFLERVELLLGVDVVLTTPAEGMQLGLLQQDDTLVLQLGMADVAHAGVQASLAPVLALPGIERRWITSPFTSAYEKHLLPQLSHTPFDPHVFVPEAFAVEPRTIERIVVEQQTLVMKHGRNLKRVLVGARTGAQAWHDAAVVAAHSGEHIAQRCVVPPVEPLPVWHDDRVQIIGVRPELSPFLIDGVLVACFVRYLPEGSASDVVSPPPKDLGLSVSWGYG